MPPEAIIGVLSGTVASLAAAIAYLYKDQAARSDARVIRQENREDEMLTQMQATLTQLAITVAAMNTTQGKIAEYITEQSILSRERGRKEGG